MPGSYEAGCCWRRRGTAGEPPQGGVHVAPDKELTHLICINAPIAPWHQSKRVTLTEPVR